MAGLIDQILISAVWLNSIVGFTNTVPASDPAKPLVSVVPNFSGEAIADNYHLTFGSVNTVAQTAQVFVTSDAPDNPFRNVAGINISIDGATVYGNVIPGFDIVFSGSGSFANTYAATVRVGDFQGTFNAYGVGAGTPGAARQHRVLNSDSGTAADCKATLKTQVQHIRKVGVIFALVKPFADGATERTASTDPVATVPGSTEVRPYRATVANVTGVGVAKVFDLHIDGATVSVLNLSSGVIAPSTGLNVVDSYKIQSGGLQTTEFKGSQLVTNAGVANLLVFPARYTQIAADVAGVAGAFATADVILTQAGESAGLIQPGGVAYYWVRTVVPDGASAQSNPYPSNVFLTGKQTGTAGWVA